MEIGEQDQTTIEDGFHNVMVKVTVTATIADKTMFLVEAAIGGIFQIRNIPEAELQTLLAALRQHHLPVRPRADLRRCTAHGHPAIRIPADQLRSDLPGSRPAAARAGCRCKRNNPSGHRHEQSAPCRAAVTACSLGRLRGQRTRISGRRPITRRLATKARFGQPPRQVLYSRGTPVEVVVSIEGWSRCATLLAR